MNFDEAIARAEQLIKELESSEALSVAEYKKKADETTKLLMQCRQELVKIEKEIL